MHFRAVWYNGVEFQKRLGNIEKVSSSAIYIPWNFSMQLWRGFEKFYERSLYSGECNKIWSYSGRFCPIKLAQFYPLLKLTKIQYFYPITETIVSFLSSEICSKYLFLKRSISKIRAICRVSWFSEIFALKFNLFIPEFKINKKYFPNRMFTQNRIWLLNLMW